MTGPALAAIMHRELRTLERELNAYHNDEQVWALPAGLPNSGGTLALHAAGNLLHFVGAVLGGSGYVRDRDAEFSRRDVPRAELIEELRRAQEAVALLATIDPARFTEPYPVLVANRRVNTYEFLAHLAVHLAYHAGQLDYHRRVVTGEAAGVGAMSPVELPSAVAVEA
ncbi:MAG TPA: DinB family protein [Gemmatimonadaceae bacterium]